MRSGSTGRKQRNYDTNLLKRGERFKIISPYHSDLYSNVIYFFVLSQCGQENAWVVVKAVNQLNQYLYNYVS